MTREEKIKSANKIVKASIEQMYDRKSYAYIDFVLEDRFIYQIDDDDNRNLISIEKSTVDEIVEYALDKINHSVSRANLFGF